MEWFADFAKVTFGGIEKVFDVSSVFCEFYIGSHLVQVNWYGVIIAFGFTLAALFGGRIAYTWRINLSKMVDVLIYGTFGGIIGARAYYVIFEWDYYSQHLDEIIAIWNGGIAIYGGVIGGLLIGALACKLNKVKVLPMVDLAVLGFLIGQGIGRWGNFVNQEAYGTFTGSDWFGMTGSKIAAEVGSNNLVHPCFLYESIWCLLGVLVLHKISKRRKFSGQIILSNDSEMFDQGGSGAVDLRESSGELGAFITKALSEPTDLTEISVKDRQYYFAGAPMPAIGWAVVSAIEKEITEGPALQLLSEYDAINETASETFRKGTAGSTRSSVLFFLLAVIAASYAALAAARNIARPIGKITRDVNRASMMNEPFVMKDE